MNMAELLVARFLLISVENKDDITIVAQHVRDLFSNAPERPSLSRDWNEYEFRDIFFLRCMAYRTDTYEITHKSAQR